jgi:hypothetical protein
VELDVPAKGKRHTLRVLESRVLRRMFGCKREQVRGDSEPHNFYSLPDIFVCSGYGR